LLLNKSLVTVVMSLAFIGTIGSLFNSFGWLVATAWQLKALHDIQKAEQQLPTTIVSQGVPNELAHSSSLY
jgi:2-oxo-4-hydroxy-4-carboxy--5-ureidoimidazoline (OHCU) decarboxylase